MATPRLLFWAAVLVGLTIPRGLTREVSGAGPQTLESHSFAFREEEKGLPVAAANGWSALITVLVDGRLLALHPDTGAELWTWDTGSPLVSSAGLTAGGADGVHGVSEGSLLATRTLLPGVDGALYAYHHSTDDALHLGLERLPSSIPELVDKSPIMAQDSSDSPVVLGSRTTSVYLLDPLTGALISGVHNLGSDSAAAEVPKLIGGDQLGGNGRSRILAIGQHNYKLQSRDPMTGEEHWNISFAHVHPLTPQARRAALDWRNAPSQLEDEITTADRALLGMSVDGHLLLRRFDPATGQELWSHRLSAPPVGVYTSEGASIPLHQGPAIGSLGVLESPDTMLVSLVEGSLVALPAPPAAWLAQQSPGSLVPMHQELWEAPSSTGFVGSPGANGTEAPADTDASEGPRDTWACPLGYHPVEHTLVRTTTDPFFLPPAAGPDPTQETDSVMGTVDWLSADQLPLILARLADSRMLPWGVVFSILAATVLYYIKYNQKQHVDTAIDMDSNGVMHMELNYSGNSQELEGLKKSSKTAVEARAGDGPSIRDYTGSGVGNSPDENSSSSSSSSGKRQAKPQKKNRGRHPRYTNWRNGVIHQTASEDSPPAEKDGEIDDSANSSTDGGQNAETPQGSIAEGWRTIGKIQIGTEILGYGSSGTLVFEGTMDGRPIAIKRLLRQFYNVARKEIRALIEADEHPNVVRCFGLEVDDEFVYLALERCKHSLHEKLNRAEQATIDEFIDDAKWPTAFCLEVVKQAARGLMALHERGIVHRDLKPHNVLLTEGNRVKISDMGLCKTLAAEQSSFDSPGAGGSSGWQAPEQLNARSGADVRQGKSVDVFSFGLLLFYCLSGGHHAFGKSFERDLRILQGRSKLQEVRHLPEAENLIAAMLCHAPKKRPSMAAVMAHPFWWSPARRLAFLIHLSDRVEPEDREEDKTLLAELEACAEEAMGIKNWAVRLDPDLMASLGKYRKYNTGSLRDLLRVIRNKHNHFREMPEDLQSRLGPVPDGFVRYFASRFPRLLLVAYGFALKHLAEDPTMSQYFPPAARTYNFLADPSARLDARASANRAAAATSAAIGMSAIAESRDGMLTEPAGVPIWASLEPILEAQDDAGGRAQSAPTPLGTSLEVPTEGGLESASSVEIHEVPAVADQGDRGTMAESAPEPSSPPAEPQQESSPPGPSGLDPLGDPPHTPSSHAVWGSGSLWGSPHLSQVDVEPPQYHNIGWNPLILGPTKASNVATSTMPMSPAHRTLGRSGSPLFWGSGISGTPTNAGGLAVVSTPPSLDPLVIPPSPSNRGLAFEGSLGTLSAMSPMLSTPWATPPPPIKSRMDPNGGREAGTAATPSHLGWPRGSGGLPDLTPPPPSPLTAPSLLPPTSPWSPRVEDADLSRLRARGLPSFHHRSGSDGAFLNLHRSPSEIPAYHHQRSSSGDALGEASLGGRSLGAEDRSQTEVDFIGLQLFKELGGNDQDGRPNATGAAPLASPGGTRFPQRPGQTVCDFFSKTGHCKFGEQCKFDHPIRYAVQYNLSHLPVRPGEPVCGFFERTGECKFGASCKFHHPNYPADHVFDNGLRMGSRSSVSQPASPAPAASLLLPPGSAGKLRRPSSDVSKLHPILDRR